MGPFIVPLLWRRTISQECIPKVYILLTTEQNQTQIDKVGVIMGNVARKLRVLGITVATVGLATLLALHGQEQGRKIRTVDSNGRMVLATGHATREEHALLAREGRRAGLQVLLTHPGDIPQLPEAAKLGAFIEVNASGTYKTEAGQRAAAALVHKIGAEHIIVGTDCGQTVNVYPADCLALTAKGLRVHGVTEPELDLMYKVNPAKLLGLSPLEGK